MLNRWNLLKTGFYEGIIVAALNDGMRQGLDLLKDWIQDLLQRSLGNGGSRQEKFPAHVRAITR